MITSPVFAGRKYAVLGDMKELGEESLAYHREIGRFAAESGLTGLLTVGELGREIAAGAEEGGLRTQSFEDNESAAAEIKGKLHSGDVVLVKGSRAMAMESIVKRLLDG